MTNPRTTSLLAGAAATLLLAACGGGSGGDGAAKDGRPSDEQMLAFAKCLREHGIDAPDPRTTAGGKVTQSIRVPRGIPVQRLQQIQEGCAKKTGGGPRPMSKADQAKALDQGLRFARCMRAHGVDLPDPSVSGGGIRIGGPGAKDAIDPQSPTFQRAQKACGALGPGFGVTKGPGGGDRGPSVSSAP